MQWAPRGRGLEQGVRPLVVGDSLFRTGGRPEELDCVTIAYRELATNSS
jgi:hypothetical protein